MTHLPCLYCGEPPPRQCFCGYSLIGNSSGLCPECGYAIERKGPASKPTLKQFRDLRRSDFEEHPVWIGCHTADYGQTWYDQTNEETFRPWSGSLPVDPVEGTLLVLAEFQLNDGSSAIGLAIPSVRSQPSHLGNTQPHILPMDGAPVAFWFGNIEPPAQEIDSAYMRLEKRAEQVFPARFKTKPGLTTEKCAGTVDGFYWERDVEPGVGLKHKGRALAMRR
ncbi:MAG: hypothetical protein HY269_06230 [Deltaproteobacteria bacterium]|nr:hypothetical protein [Deltaproteobacteria bacterium]